MSDSIPDELLETVRQYARDRLVEDGEGEAVRTRHLEFFLNWAEQRPGLDPLEAEHDNLREALGWLGAQGQGEAGLRLGGALSGFWQRQGHWTEGREHLAGLLALPGAEARTALRAKTLRSAGALAGAQGDHVEALRLLEESLAIYRELGDKRGIADGIHSLGLVTLFQGACVEARALLEESLTILREAGVKPDIVTDLEGLAAVAVAQGQPERAAHLFGAAEGLREAMGAPLRPVDRAEYDRSVAAACAALGEDTFVAAWAEGRAMSLDPAVEYALAEAGSA